MLSDREKLILHFVSVLTIVRMTGVENPEKILNKMIEDVRRERCRSVAPEDVEDILEDVDDEMQSAQLMFKDLSEASIWSMTGERPNVRKGWEDMR